MRGLVLFLALLVPASVGAQSAPIPQPTCLAQYGQTACGHHCVANFGQVRCAQTPFGTCSSGAGTVACWDPPPVVRQVLRERTPRPACVANYGQIACGYECASGFDQVQCAQTPFGACKADAGKIVCGDPPAGVIHEHRERTPRASCISQSGALACGYKCAANDGKARCAETPEGFCRWERDTLFCWDPDPSSRAVFPERGADFACISTSGGSGPGKQACGYRCLAAGQKVGCAQTPHGACKVEKGEIVCSDAAP
jgi:hypothetical protein